VLWFEGFMASSLPSPSHEDEIVKDQEKIQRRDHKEKCVMLEVFGVTLIFHVFFLFLNCAEPILAQQSAQALK
jgi:hypothetical protein